MNAERTSLFYMANLGAEVSRLCAAKGDAAESALTRCFDIIDKFLQIEVYPWREKEISILKEVIEDIAVNGNKFDVSEEDLEDYFLPFALRLQTM